MLEKIQAEKSPTQKKGFGASDKGTKETKGTKGAAKAKDSSDEAL